MDSKGVGDLAARKRELKVRRSHRPGREEEEEEGKKTESLWTTDRWVNCLWRVLSGVASLHGRRADVDDDRIDVVYSFFVGVVEG